MFAAAPTEQDTYPEFLHIPILTRAAGTNSDQE